MDGPTRLRLHHELDRLLRDRSGGHGPVPLEADLLVDLGLDSIRLIELVSDLEDALDVAIPVNDLPRLKTVNDVIDYLEPLVGAKPRLGESPSGRNEL